MTTHRTITTMGFDVVLNELENVDSRIKATRVSVELLDGTTVMFNLNDKHLEWVADGIKEYLAEKAAAAELKRRV